jgi:hypothetical protein
MQGRFGGVSDADLRSCDQKLNRRQRRLLQYLGLTIVRRAGTMNLYGNFRPARERNLTHRASV